MSARRGHTVLSVVTALAVATTLVGLLPRLNVQGSGLGDCPNGCSAHGTCTVLGNESSARCACDIGFLGADCSVAACNADAECDDHDAFTDDRCDLQTGFCAHRNAMSALKCYVATTPKGVPNPGALAVSLAGRFEVGNASLAKPKLICNPARLGRVGVNSSAGMVCWQTKDPQGAPRFPGADLDVLALDQTSALRVTRSKLTCLPGRFGGDQCAPGRFGLGGDCALCVPGRYSEVANSDACLPCETGRFASLSEAVLCEPCEVGRFVNQTGADTCLPCAAGRFTNAFESSECRPCTAGFFAAVEGTAICESCEPGRFADQQGAALCEPCNTGRFASGNASLTCLDCDPGRFVNQSAATACQPCNAGFFAGAGGSSACEECTPGRYADQQGTALCQPCDAGRFAPGNASLTCLDCDPGRFVNQSAATTCQACGPGSVATGSGSVQCVGCPLDAIAPDPTLPCETCPLNSSPDGSRTVCLCDAGFENVAAPGEPPVCIATSTTTVSTSTTTSTTMTPAGLGFEVGYRHLAPGAAVVCVRLTTSPPQPGLTGAASLFGPTGSQSLNVLLGNDGEASFSFPISVISSYSVFVTVGSFFGSQSVLVTPAQGTCPSPSGVCTGTPGACSGSCGQGETCCPLIGPGVCACEPEQFVDVIEVGGKCLPISQLHSATDPECTNTAGTPIAHWKANERFAIATDGTVVPDENPCGYALVDTTPVQSLEHCAPCVSD